MTNSLLKLVCILAFLSINLILFGQYDRPLYQWRSHLPQQIAQEICLSEKSLFYSTGLSLVRVDRTDLQGRFISKVEGLSETQINKIEYDANNHQVIIAYASGNLDFLQSDYSVTNVPDIKQNSTFVDKIINDIHVTKSSILYATRFGIVAQDPSSYLFQFTTNMNLEVQRVVEHKGKYYVATDEGIFSLELNQLVNPGDFTKWEHEGDAVGLPMMYKAEDLVVSDNRLYAIIEQEVYLRLEDGQWKSMYKPGQGELIRLSAATSGVLIGVQNQNFSSRLIQLLPDGQLNITNGCSNSLRDFVQDEKGIIWYADNWHGLRYQDKLDGVCNTLKYNSPYSERVDEIRIKNNNLYIGSGGLNESFLFEDNKNGFYTYIDNTWTNYNGNTVPLIQSKNMLNFLAVEPHPSKDLIYAASFPGGILEYDNTSKTFKVYDAANSPLRGADGTFEFVRVADIRFDAQENMWVTCNLATKPLHVRTPEGVWHSFGFGSNRNMGAIEFDDYNNLWIQLTGKNGGVLVFTHNNSFENTNDDDYVRFSNANTKMISSTVRSMAKDLDGSIWVGTQNGPVVFEEGNVFPNKSTRGSTRIVVQDGEPAPLLKTENISAIAVDGANRKWFGTSTGIYVQSADGLQQVLRYTSQNSPLMDDTILELSYDGQLGIMYIGTSKGIQSIRIDATDATARFVEDAIYAAPNPVRPDYDGPISIQGLAQDSNVKITDVSGRLVFETKANGGTAIWNGRDIHGKRVQAGVYHVIATYWKDVNNITSSTTKILVVR